MSSSSLGLARPRLNVTAPPQQHRRLRSSLVQPWDANAAYGGHTKRLHPILRHKPSHADHALGVPDNFKEMPGVIRKGNTNRRENRGLLSVRRHQFLQHAAQSLPITIIRYCRNSRLHAHCITCERSFSFGDRCLPRSRRASPQFACPLFHGANIRQNRVFSVTREREQNKNFPRTRSQILWL